MMTIEMQTKKEQITEMTETINNLEIQLMKNSHALSFEQMEETVERFMKSAFAMEQYTTIDKETLFYARLLRAKCEEVYDIIELKRAM